MEPQLIQDSLEALRTHLDLIDDLQAQICQETHLPPHHIYHDCALICFHAAEAGILLEKVLCELGLPTPA
jgi:hypothetical protein